jgi:spore germination cell wall hydrolase CwlJ-like protein
MTDLPPARDDRPADFAQRLTRRGRARPLRAGTAKRHLGRRLAVLAVAIAVPAMAAPGEWRSAPATVQSPAPMPFETAGDSFPGSAFYYLADQPYLPPAATDGATAEASRPGTADLVQSPVARSLRVAGSGTDYARALRCMTLAIYYEAATEPDAGQRAVAQVILNRVAHPSYPDTVCGVVFQGSERTTGCQFTFTCDGSLARAPAPLWWDRAEKVARAALAGAVYAPVGLAMNYHTLQVHPYWADSLLPVGSIGNHIFYRWRGPAGQSAAFADAYRGAEPVAAPHPRAPGMLVNAAEADPLALARAYENGLRAAADSGSRAPIAAAAPAPLYAAEIAARGGDALFEAHLAPAAGQVLEPYARSGEWLKQP